MKAWSVSDKWYEVQVAVIAETRGKAKLMAFFEFFDNTDWIDMRATVVKSPILVEGKARILGVHESISYGFKWNDETMDDAYPGWYEWTKEYRKANGDAG